MTSMWQEHIEQGRKALAARDYLLAEASFRDALDCAKKDFGHTDKRIPQSFAYLGRALVFSKKVEEALPALKQASRLAESLKFMDGPIALADYLWAYLDHEDPDADRRRAMKLKTLEQYMRPDVLERINRDLNELFKVTQQSPSEAGKPDEPDPEFLSEGQANTEPVADEPNQPASTGVSHKKEEGPEPIGPERYSAWAEKLHCAIERSSKPLLAELIASYMDLHMLMEESVKLYPPPHMALGDHLLALAEITHMIGLYNRAESFYRMAISNFRKSLGSSHPKTAIARLSLAEAYGSLDDYDKANEHFREAYGVLSAFSELDREWYEGKLAFFNMLKRRENMSNELFQSLDLVSEMLEKQEHKQADSLCLVLAEKMNSVFPSDHYNFCFLYNKHAQVLVASGHGVAGAALSAQAKYLDAKLKDMEKYNQEMEEVFPQFDFLTLKALQSI